MLGPIAARGRPAGGVPRRPIGGVVLGVIGAMLALAAWIYASPPGSSPDDGYHLSSIWCAAGYSEGRCLEAVGSGDPDVAFAPAVLPALTCVAGDGRRSAACQNDIYARFDGQLSLTVANISAVRATLYYRVANILVSDDIPASIARIRVMNASLVILLVALTALVAAADVRRAVLVTWIVVSIPHGLFLITSVNSTAWGFVGLGTLWANLITAARPGLTSRRIAAAALAFVGVMMALGARTEAAAHLAVIVAAIGAVVLSESRIRSSRWTMRRTLIAVAASAGVVAALSILARFSAVGLMLSITSGFGQGWERLVARGISNPAVTLAIETPQLWTGALGTWSLGWLDTNMPSTVSVTATIALVTLAAAGLTGAGRGRIAGATILLVGLVLLPVASLLSVGLVVLEELQPRHYAPLLYVFLGVALIRSRGQSPLLIGRGTRHVLAGALSIGHAVALWINIHRYTIGLTEFLYVDRNREVEWWWGPPAPLPELVWSMGALGYALVAWIVLGLVAGRSEADADASSVPSAAVRQEA